MSIAKPYQFFINPVSISYQ